MTTSTQPSMPTPSMFIEETVPVQRVTLDSGPIAYRQAGNGFPLLLLHGWRGSSRYWQPTLELLSDVRQSYALDLPGHGQTPPLRTPFSAARLAHLVIEFADTLGMECFDLNGHSLGASVAVYVAAHWPERVRRLVLTSLGTFRTILEQLALNQTYYQMSLSMALWRPWLLLWRPWLALWQPWIDWMASQPHIYRLLASNFVYQLPADDQIVREGVQEFLRTDQLTALEGAISAGDPAFSAALRRVIAPTLLISARQDRIMPASGATPLAQALPNCHLVELDRCGHIPMFEQPDRYHALVRDFLLKEAA